MVNAAEGTTQSEVAVNYNVQDEDRITLRLGRCLHSFPAAAVAAASAIDDVNVPGAYMMTWRYK